MTPWSARPDSSTSSPLCARSSRAGAAQKRAEIQELVNEGGPLPAKAFPGRAAILVALLGLSERELECVYEKPGSLKVGHYVPGTRIPIRSDEELFGRFEQHRHDRESGLAHSGRDRVLSQERRLPGPDRADCLMGLGSTAGSSSAAAVGRGSWPPSCAPSCPRIARSTSKGARAMPGCGIGGTEAPTRSASRSSSSRFPVKGRRRVSP